MNRRIRNGGLLVALSAVIGLTATVGITRVEAVAALRIRPFVVCAAKAADTLTVVFGYESTGGTPVEIPVGPRNQLTPKGSVPPPTTFDVGRIPVAFSSVFAAKAKPKWTITSGSARLSATVSSATPKCVLPAAAPSTPSTAAAATHGLTLTLEGKTTMFRYPVTTRPQKLDGQGHILVAGFKADQQAWSVLAGGQGLQVQFGWERQNLAVGTFSLGACPRTSACSSASDGYTAVLTDGKPNTTLLAYELPELALKPVTLTISSISETTFPNADPTLSPLPYRYIKGTIEGKVATVSFGESGAVLVRGPLDAKITFDLYLEQLST